MNNHYETWEISEQQKKDVCKGVLQIFREDPLFQNELFYWAWRIELCLGNHEGIKDPYPDIDEVENAVCAALNYNDATPGEAVKNINIRIEEQSDKIRSAREMNADNHHLKLLEQLKHQSVFCLAYFRYLEKHPERRASGVDQSKIVKLAKWKIDAKDLGCDVLSNGHIKFSGTPKAFIELFKSNNKDLPELKALCQEVETLYKGEYKTRDITSWTKAYSKQKQTRT